MKVDPDKSLRSITRSSKTTEINKAFKNAEHKAKDLNIFGSNIEKTFQQNIISRLKHIEDISSWDINKKRTLFIEQIVLEQFGDIFDHNRFLQFCSKIEDAIQQDEKLDKLMNDAMNEL